MGRGRRYQHMAYHGKATRKQKYKTDGACAPSVLLHYFPMILYLIQRAEISESLDSMAAGLSKRRAIFFTIYCG